MANDLDGGTGAVSGKGLTVEMSAILTVVWGGMIGYQVYAKYMIHEELFLLGMVGLVIGAMLTIAAMLWVIRLAEIQIASERDIYIRKWYPPPPQVDMSQANPEGNQESH